MSINSFYFSTFAPVLEGLFVYNGSLGKLVEPRNIRMEKDYFGKVCALIVWLFAFLILFSFIPEMRFLHITTRKLDLLSDVRPSERVEEEPEQELFLPLKADARSIPPLLNVKKWSPDIFVRNSSYWAFAKRGFRFPDLNYFLDEASKKYGLSDTIRKEVKAAGSGSKIPLAAIEDFSENKGISSDFYRRLASLKALERPLRIAFLGDSFIEGDIMTADIREQLQALFGGRGVGYMPLATIAAGYRQTIRHQYQGWEPVTMVTKDPDWSKFTLTGQYFVPDEGATVSYATTNYRQHAEAFHSLRFFFINEKSTDIHVSLNRKEPTVFTPDSGKWLQQIELKGEIRQVDVSVADVAGFTAFGFTLNDNRGIAVDNFSLRGFSGMPLGSVNSYLCSAFNKQLPYDLIVLQYGLNVAEKDVLAYGAYRDQMIRVVNRLKECYPESAVMVVSVGDRSIKGDDGFETMNAIRPMVKAQRQVAERSQVLFWNLFEAMGGANSMIRYAEHAPPYANKDYTHITHAGGKPLADAFVSAMMSGLRNFLIEDIQKQEKELYE